MAEIVKVKIKEKVEVVVAESDDREQTADMISSQQHKFEVK